MMRATCPACQGSALRRVESVSLDTLAAGWIGQPFVAQRVSAAELRAQMLADLGTDRVDVLRCAACSMEHMSPMRTWSADHYPVQEHGFGFDHVTALQRLQGGSGKLLEIGCADGAFLDATSALGYRAIGLDFAPESVAAARAAGRDVRQSGVDHLVDAVAGDAPFDVIAMFQIIEHLEAPDETFSALGTLAHRDTRLLIGCPSPRRFARAYPHAERVGLSEFWDYPPQHTMRWTPAAMRRFLARHGWSVVHVAEEPFTLVGAAAFLTSSTGRHAGWYGHAWRRRATTAGWMLRLAATGAPLRFSGVRLYVEAARTASA